MAEPIINVLGVVGMKIKGEYDDLEVYEKLNVVTYQGSSYCAKTSTQGNLPTDTNFWDLIAEKGDTGEKGDTPVKGTDYYTAADKAELEATLSTDVTSEVTDQLSDLTSATPIAVSSASGMTDTSRIYVLTTDGHWYWYNGTAWTDGGVYQATGIAETSVYVNSLTKTTKNELYKTLSCEDILFINNFSWANGILSPNSDTNTIYSSVAFKVSKNSKIKISSDYKGRVTFWDEEGNYISNTGTLIVIGEVTVGQDGYAAVTLQSSDSETPISSVLDINNDSVELVGLKSKKFDFIDDCSNYTIPSGLKPAVSDYIPVGKGTIIKIIGRNVKKNNGEDNINYQIQTSISCYDFDKKIIGSASSYSYDDYVVNQDCYIKISIRQKNNYDILYSDVSFFKNLIDIDYKFPTTSLEKDASFYQAYIGNNKDVIIHSPSPTVATASLFRLEDSLNICKNGNERLIATMNDIITSFPNNTEEYQDNTWIRLPYRTALIFDKTEENLQIKSWSAVNLLNDYILMVNANKNVCGGILFENALKRSESASLDVEIFNSSPFNESVDWKSYVRTFNALMNTSSKVETFTFFTDQHLLGNTGSEPADGMNLVISTLQKIYNSCTMNFIVNGGDWLNHGDTPDQACYKLGYVDGFMHSMFKNYHPVLGNHDSNYQGTEALSQQAIDNLWFRKEKGNKSYYSFDGICSKNYVLDSGSDWNPTVMTSYRWEQVDWLANIIKDDDAEHATVFSHIIWNTSAHVLPAFMDNITKLINAYNNHTTITLNNITYDFTNNTGHVDYVLGGHLHADYNDTINGVLCIATTRFNQGYDLVCNDYGNNKVRMIRVGTGENREFDI